MLNEYKMKLIWELFLDGVSVREMEKRTGVPKSTCHDFIVGKTHKSWTGRTDPRLKPGYVRIMHTENVGVAVYRDGSETFDNNIDPKLHIEPDEPEPERKKTITIEVETADFSKSDRDIVKEVTGVDYLADHIDAGPPVINAYADGCEGCSLNCDPRDLTNEEEIIGNAASPGKIKPVGFFLEHDQDDVFDDCPPCEDCVKCEGSACKDVTECAMGELFEGVDDSPPGGFHSSCIETPGESIEDPTTHEMISPCDNECLSCERFICPNGDEAGAQREEAEDEAENGVFADDSIDDFPPGGFHSSRVETNPTSVQDLFAGFLAAKESFEKQSRVLAFSCAHLPYEHPFFLQFLEDMYHKHNCNRVVCLGDLIDKHAMSFHTSDPNMMSAGYETKEAIRKAHMLRELFPKADWCLGNHDLIALRKAHKAGVSDEWVRAPQEVLGLEWNVCDKVIIDGVLYRHHGPVSLTASKAGMSVVQGHEHSKGRIVWHGNEDGTALFSAQCPSLIDKTHEAFAYGKTGPEALTGCTVVLESGQLPIIEILKGVM